MTLQEAIQNLKEEARHYHYLPDHKKEQATKLGIEALRVVERCRHTTIYSFLNHLEGETEE